MLPVVPLSWPLLSGMILGALLTPLGSTMIAVALPGIGRETGRDAAALNLGLVVSYLVVSFAGQGPGGKLGDRIGHERALLAGIALFGLGAAVGASAGSFATLALARVLMAAGGAITFPSTMALLRNRTSPERRARVFGAFSGAMGLAAALGPIVGGALVAASGWRATFALNVPLALVALLLVGGRGPLPTPAHAPASRGGFDLAGLVLLVPGVTALVIAATPGFPPGLALAAPGLLGAFVVRELRVASPVLDVRLFARRAIAAASVVLALQNLAMYALLFHVPLALARVPGADAATAGPVLLGLLGAMVVFAPVGGRVAERAGARATAFVGASVSLAGLLLLRTLAPLAATFDVFAALVAVGAGLGLVAAPAQASAMSAAGELEAGAAAGALSTARYLGGIAGIALLAREGVGATELPQAWVVALAGAAVATLLLPGAGGDATGRDALDARSAVAVAANRVRA